MARERKSKKGKALHIRGLRQRWMVNSVAPVCVLLILVVTLVAAGVAEYYYGSMQRGLEQRAQATAALSAAEVSMSSVAKPRGTGRPNSSAVK